MLRIAPMPTKSVRYWMDNERASGSPSPLHDEVTADSKRERPNGAVHAATSRSGWFRYGPTSTYIVLHHRERAPAPPRWHLPSRMLQ